MKHCIFKVDSYPSIIIKTNTHETNTDSPTTTATSLMFKLSSMFENSVTKVGGAETSKFWSIPQSDGCRSNRRDSKLGLCLNTVLVLYKQRSEHFHVFRAMLTR